MLKYQNFESSCFTLIENKINISYPKQRSPLFDYVFGIINLSGEGASHWHWPNAVGHYIYETWCTFAIYIKWINVLLHYPMCVPCFCIIFFCGKISYICQSARATRICCFIYYAFYIFDIMHASMALVSKQNLC